MARCKGPSCGAEIVWGRRTRSAAPMPLDAVPNAAGNVRVARDRYWPDGSVVVVEVVGKGSAPRQLGLGDLDPVDVYMPHHATCPDAETFREETGG